MEKLLLKLARQLDALDEASLMALWSKYATLASRFEPTRRWEEGALVFSLIQAKRWKNQLFNYCWREQRRPPEISAGGSPRDAASASATPEGPVPGVGFVLEQEKETITPPCRVLSFRPLRENVRPDDTADK